VPILRLSVLVAYSACGRVPWRSIGVRTVITSFTAVLVKSDGWCGGIYCRSRFVHLQYSRKCLLSMQGKAKQILGHRSEPLCPSDNMRKLCTSEHVRGAENGVERALSLLERSGGVSDGYRVQWNVSGAQSGGEWSGNRAGSGLKWLVKCRSSQEV